MLGLCTFLAAELIERCCSESARRFRPYHAQSHTMQRHKEPYLAVLDPLPNAIPRAPLHSGHQRRIVHDTIEDFASRGRRGRKRLRTMLGGRAGSGTGSATAHLVGAGSGCRGCGLYAGCHVNCLCRPQRKYVVRIDGEEVDAGDGLEGDGSTYRKAAREVIHIRMCGEVGVFR